MAAQSSHRARRLQRAKKNKVPGLNLVSLMDIFTILVFFLLVNSSNIQAPSGDVLKLPQAKVDQPVVETLVIEVNRHVIAIQGREIANVADVLALDLANIPELLTELQYQSSRATPDGQSDDAGEEPRTITVMGDREVPYGLLKKIMVTASQANFGKVSLVVISKPLRKA